MKCTDIFRALLALGIFFILVGCSSEEKQTAPIVAPAKVIKVEILKIIPADIVEEFNLPGSVEAWQDLRLSAEIAGPITRFDAK